VRVTHLSVGDVSGGAFRSAYRLHEGLGRIGIESTMLVQDRQSQDPKVLRFSPPTDSATRLRRISRRFFLRQSRKFHYSRRPVDWNLFTDDRSEHAADILRQVPPTDVLNLHWIPGLFDYRSFFRRIPKALPIVWTLHDMNPFTGGCHYAGDCRRFLDSCGDCPQLVSSNVQDISRAIWKRKREAYGFLRSDRFNIVTPSRWLAGEAGESGLMKGFSANVIPYGLDTHVFQPREKSIARDLLNVPSEAKVLLFIAQHVGVSYKGLSTLVEAIGRLEKIPNLFLLILGNGQFPSQSAVSRMSLGFVKEERLVSLAYSAADLFVLPTLRDNLPNTALEAMACGLPIVAFETGGVPEIVRHESTGLLVTPSDTAGLAKAIENLLSDCGRRQRMAENSRRIAVEEYALEVQARRYASLYTSLVNQCARS
jgi:glycosyltransferase involved in cell wall biosynthesis